MFGNHHLNACSDALRPELRPWHGSRSDIGPAVFVLFFARGRDVLDMDKRNATSIPLYPTTWISPAAHHPGEIGFPQETIAKDILDRQRTVRQRLELKVVVVPREAQARGRKPLPDCQQSRLQSPQPLTVVGRSAGVR